MRLPALRRTLLVICLAAAGTTAQAGDFYVKAGLPAGIFGYAQPVGNNFGLRVDLASVGEVQEQRPSNRIQYDARLKLDRAALSADWFALAGEFRSSGGVNTKQYRLDMQASGAGGSLTIGSTRHSTTAADELQVNARLPSTTPSVGYGWGHQASTGLRLSADVGEMVGRSLFSSSVNDPLAQRVTQADLDAELAAFRNSVDRVRAVPQVSLGLGYSF